MKYQEYIEKIFNRKVVLSKLNKGLTNDIYTTVVDGIKYAIRIPKDDSELIINIEHEKDILKYTNNLDIDVQEYYFDEKTRVRITYFVEVDEFQDYDDDNKYRKVAKMLKKLHSMENNVKHVFDPIKTFYKYHSNIKNMLFDIDEYMIIIDKVQSIDFNPCVCHNDLVSGNLLFAKDKEYLIDYEYAGLNDPLFDVMSFFTENDIYDDHKRKLFYDEYFDNLDENTIENLKIYEGFHNLLWLCWANMMYELRKESIYYEIALNKYSNLVKFFVE